MTLEKRLRAKRVVKAAVIATTILYVISGGLLIGAAYAQQTRSSIFPAPNKPIMKVPTGSGDAAVKAFFDYDNLRHVSSLEETYIVNPSDTPTMFLVAGVALIMFYVLAFSWSSDVHAKSDLYPVEVYNGYMAERGGPIGVFVWAGWAVALTYMTYYTVINLMYGQYY
jgi:hypothetical protein